MEIQSFVGLQKAPKFDSKTYVTFEMTFFSFLVKITKVDFS